MRDVGRRPVAAAGPVLGIHLGMSGKVVFADGRGEEIDGGDYWERGRARGDFRFSRFALTFADGGALVLVDPRRLGRVRLDPPVEALGPDAREVTPAQFRAAMARGTAPVKARLLDQESIAGVGNLLADQALWLARINPGPAGRRADPGRGRPALHGPCGGPSRPPSTRRRAHALGGPGPPTGGLCPRCGAPMRRGTVGGRTTWWCSREQA